MRLAYFAIIFVYLNLACDSCVGLNVTIGHDFWNQIRPLFKPDVNKVFVQHVMKAFQQKTAFNRVMPIKQDRKFALMTYMRHKMENMKKSTWSRQLGPWLLRHG